MKTGINLHRCIISALANIFCVFSIWGVSHTFAHMPCKSICFSRKKNTLGLGELFQTRVSAVRGSQRLENLQHKSHCICLNSQKVCATPSSLPRRAILHGRTAVSRDALLSVRGPSSRTSCPVCFLTWDASRFLINVAFPWNKYTTKGPETQTTR